jgi:hypothetical protein
LACCRHLLQQQQRTTEVGRIVRDGDLRARLQFVQRFDFLRVTRRKSNRWTNCSRARRSPSLTIRPTSVVLCCCFLRVTRDRVDEGIADSHQLVAAVFNLLVEVRFMPNDPTNLGRSLLLLQQVGLIKLKDGVGLLPTSLDFE